MKNHLLSCYIVRILWFHTKQENTGFGCIRALHAPEVSNSQEKLIIQRKKQPRHFVGGNKVPKMVLSKSPKGGAGDQGMNFDPDDQSRKECPMADRVIV